MSKKLLRAVIFVRMIVSKYKIVLYVNVIKITIVFFN